MKSNKQAIINKLAKQLEDYIKTQSNIYLPVSMIPEESAFGNKVMCEYVLPNNKNITEYISIQHHFYDSEPIDKNDSSENIDYFYDKYIKVLYNSICNGLNKIAKNKHNIVIAIPALPKYEDWYISDSNNLKLRYQEYFNYRNKTEYAQVSYLFGYKEIDINNIDNTQN